MISSTGQFDFNNYQKIFYKGELSDVICKVTIMALDNYDSTINPERSLKFQLYSKYILDVILDKNKFYNMGINNLQYLKTSSFDVFLNKERIINYVKSYENKEMTTILDKMENENWKYNKNEIEFNDYVKICIGFLNEIITLAKRKLPWNINLLFCDKLVIYETLGKKYKSNILEFQKIIKFNKFISVIDCFIYNYTEANIKDIRRSTCETRLPFELRNDLLVLFMALIFDDPENFNLIMNLDGKCFTNLFLEKVNRDKLTYKENVIFAEKKERNEWIKIPHDDLYDLYQEIIYENISIDCYLKFLSVTSDLICYSKYQFINIKFFTDSMTETCKFINGYRSDEFDALKLFKRKSISNNESINVINTMIDKKYPFLQIYLEIYKLTIGISEEEKAIQLKIDNLDDEEEKAVHLKFLNHKLIS